MEVLQFMLTHSWHARADTGSLPCTRAAPQLPPSRALSRYGRVCSSRCILARGG